MEGMPLPLYESNVHEINPDETTLEHSSSDTTDETAEEADELPEGVAPTLRLKLSRLPKMTKRARAMLRRAIEAYIERDVSKANAIVKRDRKLDRQYRKFFAEAMAEMTSQHVAEMPTYLLWIAHNLERIGDRTTNLAERVVFMVTGQYTEVMEDYE
jgi:phosphate transport system protein